MVDQILGYILLGLGIKNPWTGDVQGVRTENHGTRVREGDDTTSTGATGASGRWELESDQGSSRSGGRKTRPAQTLRDEARANADALREQAKQKREDLRTQTEAKRDEARQNVEQKKAEHRAALVDRLTARMKETNSRRTGNMMNRLERLGRILEKVGARAQEAKTNGKDVSSVETAIASARTAIDSAKTAVSGQSQKTYSVGTSGTDTKALVGETIKTMQSDLRAVNEQILAARKAVKDAIVALARALGEPVGEDRTTSTGGE